MPVAEQVVTSAWTPPHTIVGFSGTAEETASHIMLNWDQSTLSEADFTNYRVYRRLAGDTLWTIMIDIPNISVTSFEDNTAGQTIQYEYMVTQFKEVVGDVPLESDPSDIVNIALQSDAWFIVMLTGSQTAALELVVTDEEHSSVVQQEVFEPLASNRKRMIRGTVLGDEGSVTAVFDTSQARFAKQQFEIVKNFSGPHILKSPFGDVWFVEFDAPGYKYGTGGHLTVSIGWVEVV